MQNLDKALLWKNPIFIEETLTINLFHRAGFSRFFDHYDTQNTTKILEY